MLFTKYDFTYFYITNSLVAYPKCDFMVLGHDGIRVTWWFSNFQAFAPKIVYEDGSMTATLEMIDDNVSKMLLK